MNTILFELAKAVLIFWDDFKFNHPDEAKETPEFVKLAGEALVMLLNASSDTVEAWEDKINGKEL